MNRRTNLKQLFIIITILIAIALIIWLILSRQTQKLRDTYRAQSQQNFEEICDNFKSKLTQSDKTATEISLIGEYFIKLNQTKLGLIALNTAINKDNSIRDINLYTAKVYFDNHDYQKALELAKHAKDLDPIYWPTYSLLTEIYTALGDEENSQICYNKSKEFNPENHQ